MIGTTIETTGGIADKKKVASGVTNAIANKMKDVVKGMTHKQSVAVH